MEYELLMKINVLRNWGGHEKVNLPSKGDDCSNGSLDNPRDAVSSSANFTVRRLRVGQKRIELEIVSHSSGN